MLFNSLEFLIFFLPLTLALFFILSRFSRSAALTFLTAASALFVGWKEPAFLLHISASIFVNYFIFRWLLGSPTKKSKSLVFFLGVGFNVFCIFYFKYFNFFIESFNALLNSELNPRDILLPLGISFYTFQQISFLHDALNEKIGNTPFLNYALFVLFFPQLIAGPIIRHGEILPAFDEEAFYKPDMRNLSVGLSIFTFGLFKKLIFADGASKIVDVLFGAIADGQTLHFSESWLAVVAFSMQIYFDFSGYSDMAVGLGRLFNVKFPSNFYSPYQATSVIDFWRRWHITLSTFLRENLYIPLGGGKKGKMRKALNLMTTMLLGGLWHGASWTFVVWGGLHGVFLTINHLLPKKKNALPPSYGMRLLKQIFVFFLVSFAWVFFRAENFSTALSLLKSLFGMNGIDLPSSLKELSTQLSAFIGTGFAGNRSFILEDFALSATFIAFLAIIVLFFPNTYDWHFLHEPSLAAHYSEITQRPFFAKVSWRPTLIWAPIILLLLLYSFSYVTNEQEFIYFQF